MERQEIQRLFKQHYAKMLRVARTILYDEQESKDVVSDIFEGLLRGRTELMADTEQCYLLTSVRNQCLKRIRHQETRLRMETASAAVVLHKKSYCIHVGLNSVNSANWDLLRESLRVCLDC